MKKEDRELKNILKEKGLKVTPTRTVIFKILKKTEKPLSAKDIKLKLRTRDPVTIYRTLEQFTGAGIIKKLSLSNERSYFEYAPKHHHHVVCTSWSAIEELSGCFVPENKSVRKKARKFESISHHSLEFFGICKACHNS